MTMGPRLGSANCRTAARAVWSSGWTGTMRLRPPLPWRTRRVGWSESSDRSAASSASASETLNPALHWSSINTLAREVGAAARIARSSEASRYSGSVEPLPPEFCCSRSFLGCSPRARQTIEVVALVVIGATISLVLLQGQPAAFSGSSPRERGIRALHAWPTLGGSSSGPFWGKPLSCI